MTEPGLGQLITEECLAAKVRLIHRLVVGTYDDALRATGLTVAQLDLLATLHAMGPDVRAADVSRAMHLERSTLSRNLRLLKRRGWVEAVGTTKRERRLRLTSSGVRVAAEAATHWVEAQDDMRQRLGPSGVRAVDTLVRRLTRQHTD